MQPVIVLGDKTSHGGTVITCSSTSDTHGKGWARVGDMVSCPRCKGIFPISEGDNTLTDEGLAVAYHGCKTACGATLIAGQQFTLRNAGAVTGEGSDSVTANGLSPGVGAIGTGLAAAYMEESLDDAGKRFRGRFQLLDARTGQPVQGQAARVRSTEGQYLTGNTDSDGFTEWVERDAAESLAFDIEQKEDV